MPPVTAEAPAGYATEDEFPIREIPDTPLWSENYCYPAFDTANGIGFWMHLGRTPADRSLWRELVVLYLPSGELLLVKGYGRGATERGPGGTTLSFQCEEPWNRWTTRLDGVGVVTTRERLDRGLATDGVHVPVSFELDWQGLGPIWEMGEEMRKQSWGQLHYEQLC